MPPGPAPAPKHPPGSSLSKESKRLSCIACRQRKVKCDRLLPCAPCTRSGLTCVFPKPAPPRPRTGAKARSAEIQGRLSRLESLVGAMGGEQAVLAKAKVMEARKEGREVNEAEEGEGLGAEEEIRGEMGGQEEGEGDGRGRREEMLKREGGRWLSGDFWTNLSSEVDGLKELLNEPSEFDDEDEGDNVSSPATSNSQTDIAPGGSPSIHFMFPGGENQTIDLTPLYPYPPLITLLFETYFNRFDPTFKLLHKPSTYTIFQTISYDTNRPAIRSGQEALVFAIFFAAVTCSSADEIYKQFHEERSVLVKRYERATEAALSNSDFINTTSPTTLQALVIYLACYRSHHKTRTAWTLISTAVRIAYALDLHCDGATLSLPPYEVEIRRRLFWSIIFLDVQATEDRGSTPIVMEHTFDTHMPSNLNDEDLDPTRGLLRAEHTGCTEMTFSLICYEASRALQILAATQPRQKTFVPVYTPSREDRERRVNDVSHRLHSRFIVHCDPKVPIDWFCSMVAQIVILKFFLLSHYPVFSISRPNPPRPASRPGQESMLSTCVSLLELQHRLEHSGVSWAWIARNFVQWHPLACTLATLCGIRPGQGERLVQRAWAIVEVVFEEWSGRVGDGKTGGLWAPIRKLLERARAVHGRRSPGRAGSSEASVVGAGEKSGRAAEWASAGAGVRGFEPQVPDLAGLGVQDLPAEQQAGFNAAQGEGGEQQMLYNQSVAMALDNPFLHSANVDPGVGGMGMGSVTGVGMEGVQGMSGVSGVGGGVGVGVGALQPDLMDTVGWQEWERFLETGYDGAPAF